MGKNQIACWAQFGIFPHQLRINSIHGGFGCRINAPGDDLLCCYRMRIVVVPYLPNTKPAGFFRYPRTQPIEHTATFLFIIYRNNSSGGMEMFITEFNICDYINVTNMFPCVHERSETY